MNPESLIVQTPVSDDFIDLGMGNPDLALLPEVFLQSAAERAFAGGMRASLQYGAEQGNGFFRAALADFLSESFGQRIAGDSLFISTGSSSALDLLCTLYAKAGDTVFVEEPTYFLALRIFADHRLNVVSLPMDVDGVSLDALEEALFVHRPAFFYTIPTFQNPSGRSLSLARREKLLALAEKHGFFVIADEVYHLLGYGEKPPKAFALFAAEAERAISVNSFSKILAPGLRLGWVQAGKKVMKRLKTCGLLDSGGGLNPFASAIVHEMLEAGDLQRHLLRLKQSYAARSAVMDGMLKKWLPELIYDKPQGGFFYWVQAPNQDTASLRQQARAHKVDFRPGALFSANQGMQAYMRLCFAYYDEADLEEGIKRLHRFLDEYRYSA